MNKTAMEKVPGGKLVRIKLDFDEVINSIQITGDFFCHPEETIEKVEQALVGTAINEEVKDKIENALIGAQLIGATAEDLVRIIKKAIQ